MHQDLQFIPVPKSIIPAFGRCHLTGNPRIDWSGIIAADVDRLKEALAANGIIGRNDASDVRLILRINPSLVLPASARADVRDEAYRLSVRQDEVSLTGITARGLYYGIQTLGQMLRQTRSLPAVDILDWPDLPFRGLHLTLGSGHMPTLERLLELVQLMGHYKLNQFIIEYDDRFPFEQHPVLKHPCALPDKDAIRQIIERAQRNCMEVVPLLDSLGHAQAYLVHDEYKGLAEVSGQIAEMCPSNPSTLSFMKELWREVLEVHHDCRYANITGDEVFRLGRFCDRCGEYADSNSLGQLFGEYYNDLSRWILEQGRLPMLWSDMLIRHPDSLDLLPREIVVCDWDYRAMIKSTWDVSKVFGHEAIHYEDMEDLPSEIKERFGRYLIQSQTAPRFTPFPCVQYFKDAGYQIIASSAASGEVGCLPTPTFFGRISNNRYSALAATRAEGLGLMCTFWSSHRTLAGSMHGVLAAAEYSWHAREEANADLLKRMQVLFVESSCGNLAQLADAIDPVNVPPSGYTDETVPAEASCTITRIADELVGSTQGCTWGRDYVDVLRVVSGEASLLAGLKRIAAEIDASHIGKGIGSPIHLQKAANLSLDTCQPMPRCGLRDMGRGYITARNVEFAVGPVGTSDACVIGLFGKRAPDRPKSIALEIDDRFDRLFFLQNSAYAKQNDHIASLRVIYEDGTAIVEPIICGVNTADWYCSFCDSLPILKQAVVGWRGRTYGTDGHELLAYLSWWDNPKPDVRISQVEFISNEKDGYHNVLAITGRKEHKFLPVDSDRLMRELEHCSSALEKIKSDLRKTYLKLMTPSDCQVSVEGDWQPHNRIPELLTVYRQRLAALSDMQPVSQ